MQNEMLHKYVDIVNCNYFIYNANILHVKNFNPERIYKNLCLTYNYD